MSNILSELEKLGVEFEQNALIKSYTTFKIGGTFNFIVFPKTVDEIKSTLEIFKNNAEEFIVFGKGSNVLVADKHINKSAIVLSKNFNKISIQGGMFIQAEAGASLQSISKFALECGFTGLEFAYGIPASLGGAIYMNAGAYGGSISEGLFASKYIDTSFRSQIILEKEHKFDYRHSIYQEMPSTCIHEGLFLLKEDNPEIIKRKMDNYMERRKKSQPLNYPSAGSVFKRPKDNFAGALIEKCGLKGFQIGGAAVSEKHAGFIINVDNATFDDVSNLIKHIKQTVLEKEDILLEEEVKYIN
ncbi:MAG: UDP-N-acetylmuramate dehydrogenase [Clostridia bacterium]|nr:UDP-N-acetylmuramate dehydrogenase [Clostridia bacterium]